MSDLPVLTRAGTYTTLAEADVQAFVANLRGRVVFPADAHYDDVRMLYNRMIDKRPALIVQCNGTADVIDTVNFVRQHNLLMAVRGGGHNHAGNSSCNDGILLDLSQMNAVWVDPVKRIARAQGGATWGDMDRETQAFGLATPGGQVSTTGIGGLTLGGGLSSIRNKFGLTIDNLHSADVVTADGQLRHASSTENPDLFWAIRGGGGSFGVVTSFEFQLHPVGPVLPVVVVAYPADEAHTVMAKWRDFMQTAPDELSSQASFLSIPAVPMFKEENQGKLAVAIVAVYCGPLDEGVRVMQPLHEFGTVLEDLSGPFPYRILQSAFDSFYPKGDLYHYYKSIRLSHYNDDVIEVLAARAASLPTPRTTVEIWHFGGAMQRVSADTTAYGDRSAPFLVVLGAIWSDPADNEANVAWTRDFWSALKPFSSGGMYLNFPGQFEEGESLMRATFGGNYARLAELRQCYDPDGMFQVKQQNPVPVQG